MGKNTFVITVDETGQSKSCTINVEEPEFLEGYWTKDKKGNQPLEKAVLGDTVYFHVKTKGLADGQELELRLGEYDYSFWFDSLDPDDYEFPEEEIIKKAIIKNDKAIVELILQESWQGIIKDDHNEWCQSNESIELYWEVGYGKRKKELPNHTDNYLRVAQSNKTLYFKTPIPNHNLPEFISNDGDPMLLMKFAQGYTGNKIKTKVLDLAKDKANKAIQNIAFAKLEKGYMVDNMGKVYKGKRLIREYKEIYSNSGELFENVKSGKNFGYKHEGQPLKTTKGISQYDYFSKTGKKVKLLGLVKSLGHVFDIFNLFKVATEELDTSKPIPLDSGPLSPIFDLAGVLVQQQKAEMDMWLEEDVQQEIDLAKLEGLKSTRKAINTWNHNEQFNWQLMAISGETANKLLQGKFNTFDELETSNFDDIDNLKNIEILYRMTEDSSRENMTIYVIETIFIDE